MRIAGIFAHRRRSVAVPSVYAAPSGEGTATDAQCPHGRRSRKPPASAVAMRHDLDMSDSATDDPDSIRHAFHDAVNMTASELSDWLETDESRSVGQKEGGDGESTGHRSGRRIVELLRTKKDDLSDDDLAHMKKVTGYVSRHSAQRPDGDVTETAWRYSLMNWGNDPLK